MMSLEAPIAIEQESLAVAFREQTRGGSPFWNDILQRIGKVQDQPSAADAAEEVKRLRRRIFVGLEALMEQTSPIDEAAGVEAQVSDKHLELVDRWLEEQLSESLRRSTTGRKPDLLNRMRV